MDKAISALRSQEIMLNRAKRFVDKVKSVFNIEEVYVVGSRARGDYLEDSDIDLVIISDDVKGLKYIDRMEKLSEFTEPKVEFFVFTKEEWENPSSLYIKEMKKEAKRLEDLLQLQNNEGLNT